MKKAIVIHPFLFAVYPILFLYSHNIEQLDISEIFFPSALVLGLTVALMSLGYLVFKNIRKSGILVSIFWILFFTYGQLYRPSKIVFGVALLTAAYFTIRSKKELRSLNSILNFIAAILVGITAVNIGAYGLKGGLPIKSDTELNAANGNSEVLMQQTDKPDIYYIIPDSYGRADKLSDLYGFDNSDFLDYLENKGFYIARKSRSNYGQTHLSLASSLNLQYLDILLEDIGNYPADRKPLRGLVKRNRAFKFLKQYGYRIVAFPTSYSGTEIEEADRFVTPGLYLNEFQSTLLNTTFIPSLLNRLNIYYLYDLHRNIIMNIFRSLGDTPFHDEPIFVFAHIVSPHPPFVFGEHGERVNQKNRVDLDDGDHFMKLEKANKDIYVAKYINQLQFVNARIKDAIDRILSDTSRPSIIILQSDHGPGSRLNWDDPGNTDLGDRLSILNAYYFPDRDYTALYEKITPVNTFRVIFNRYFGADYELLKDESFFSTWDEPYDFIDIDDDVISDDS